MKKMVIEEGHDGTKGVPYLPADDSTISPACATPSAREPGMVWDIAGGGDRRLGR